MECDAVPWDSASTKPAAVLIAAIAATILALPGRAAVGPGGDTTLLPGPPPGAAAPAIPDTIPGGPQGGPDRNLLNAAVAATMAADTFAFLAKDSATSGIVPDHNDPRAATLLSTVFGVGGIRARVIPGRADLPALLAWLDAVENVASIYVFAGTGVTDPSTASGDPKVAAATDLNTALHAPEVGQSIDASVALSAMMALAAASSITDITATDAGRTGLDQLRGGIAGAVTDAVSTLTTAGLDADWRQARLTALLAAAPDLAQLLLPDQCSAIRLAADQTAQALADPVLTTRLQSFDAALAC
jgi:hypothetical protein